MSLRLRGLATLVLLAVTLVAATAARAEIVVRDDAAGRTITFDVLAPAVDVDWYASILAAAAHGDEISRVTILIVPAAEVESRCGADAAACYERRAGVSTIILPAGRSSSLAAIVLHEYGHHLDASWAVDGIAELNGTPAWWAARGMAGLLHGGSVAFDYSLGWSRSIGEVFAEDYAYLQGGGHYSIPWLAPPDEALRAALLAELGTGAAPPTVSPPPPAAEPEVRPVVAARAGLLRPRSRVAIPFELLGAGRRVTVTAGLAPLGRGHASGRLEIVCGNAVVGTADLRRRTATLDLRGLGPALCRATVVSTTGARQRYSLRIRLALT